MLKWPQKWPCNPLELPVSPHIINWAQTENPSCLFKHKLCLVTVGWNKQRGQGSKDKLEEQKGKTGCWDHKQEKQGGNVANKWLLLWTNNYHFSRSSQTDFNMVLCAALSVWLDGAVVGVWVVFSSLAKTDGYSWAPDYFSKADRGHSCVLTKTIYLSPQ